MFPFIRNESGFTTIIDGDSFSVNSSHLKYRELLAAVKSEDAATFRSLVSVEESIKSYEANSFTVELKDDEVFVNGKPVHSTLANRIVEFAREDLPFEHMLRFMEKLYQNPSNTAINELFDFLANEHLPICDDGDFLAYKVVTNDYWSKRGGDIELISGTVDGEGRIYNGLGELIECKRSSVDDDRTNKCSNGLHIGGLKYSGPGGTYYKVGNRTVIVKVNPADVVSVPKDYNAQKARVCKYLVYSDYQHALPSVSTSVPKNESPDWVNSDVETLFDDDLIIFNYKDKTRKLYIDDIDGKFVSGYLDNDDPSFSVDGNNYRRFYRDKMENIKFKVVNDVNEY